MWRVWPPNSPGQLFGLKLRPCPGVTLREILVTFALLSMVMSGVYLTLSLALRYQRKLADSVTTFERALHTVKRISQALGNGAQRSLVVEPQGFAFVSAVSETGVFAHDPNGKLQWQRYEFFYLEDEALYRGAVPFPPTSNLPTTPPVSELRAQAPTAPILLAGGVKELEMITGSGASTRLVVVGAEDGQNMTTLETRVTFRQ